MNGVDINQGFWIKNPSECSDEITIAVTGLGRSGTTMVARVLSELGVYMGENVTPQTNEDKDIQISLKEKDFTTLKDIIKNRNSNKSVWGFKCPALRTTMLATEKYLRNPRYIVLFRDILSISIRNNISMDYDMKGALESAQKSQGKMLTQLEKISSSALCISYEKALQFPKETVRVIAEYCNLEISESEIDKVSKVIVNGDPKYLNKV